MEKYRNFCSRSMAWLVRIGLLNFVSTLREDFRIRSPMRICNEVNALVSLFRHSVRLDTTVLEDTFGPLYVYYSFYLVRSKANEPSGWLVNPSVYLVTSSLRISLCSGVRRSMRSIRTTRCVTERDRRWSTIKLIARWRA